MTVCALPWDASLNGRGVGDWNPGRPMATPAETVDAYCVDWCKARCEALGADAKDAWRPEARLPSFHTIATNSRWRLPSGGPTAIPRRRCIRPEPDPSLIIPLSSHRSTTRRRSSSSPGSNPRGSSRTSSARRTPPRALKAKRATRSSRPSWWSPRGSLPRRPDGTKCSRSSGTRPNRCTRSRSPRRCTPPWSPPTSRAPYSAS